MSLHTSPADATLALLAGGEGSRMRKPKGELQVNDIPLAEHVWRRANWPGPTLLVTAPGRERPPGANVFDREVADPVSGTGPLRGILTALESATTPLLLIAALDMPRMARPQFDWLVEQLRVTPDAAGLICRRRGEIEPLPCVLRTELATGPVGSALAAGRRSLRSLLEDPGFRPVDVPIDWPPDVWTNLNDPAAWDAFVRESTNRPDGDY